MLTTMTLLGYEDAAVTDVRSSNVTGVVGMRLDDKCRGRNALPFDWNRTMLLRNKRKNFASFLHTVQAKAGR